MFSAVISTAATQLARVKEDEAKEKKTSPKKTPKSRSPWVHSSAPYLGIISVLFFFSVFFFYTDIISAAAAVYSITVMCVRSCAYPTPPFDSLQLQS